MACNESTISLDAADSLHGDELFHISQHTEERRLSLDDLKTFLIRDRWEDLRFPVQGINPLGAGADPSIDATTYPGTLLFSTSADNHIAGTAQMPHGWEYGSTISPHIHWSKTTADGSGLDVAWKFRYSICAIGSTPSAYSSWQDHTLAAGDLTTQEKHNLSSFPDITMTGYLGSVVIFWEIMRDVSEDTYGSDARLIEFDIHYKIDKIGSQSVVPNVADY